MTTEPARWIRRFDNYKRAFAQLEEGVELAGERELSDLEKEGLIQRFEYTQELAWNVIKDFFNYQGDTNIQGSRDAFRMASERELITQGDVLMESIKSRNDTVHTYDSDTAEEIFRAIVEEYYDAFVELEKVFDAQVEKREAS